MGGAAALWAQADLVRRQQGQLMEQMGLGPQRTPSRNLAAGAEAHLLAYQAPRPDRPAVLAVPAPIKAAYIWDLAPDVSVVRRLLAAGLQVYLIEWTRPPAGDTDMGLARYAAVIARCLELIADEIRQPAAFVAGHSLGGTLGAIVASLHPHRILGLVELEGPMHFGAPGRVEAAAAQAGPAASLVDFGGTVAGTALDACSMIADPVTFALEPWIDAWSSWLSPRNERLHWRVRRWTLDEWPLPRRMFEEVLEELYRRNRFAERTLVVDGQRADPRAITAPIVAVVDRRSRVVPAASVEAYRGRTASRRVELLEYGGDTGVLLQHVGILVGDNAHRVLWPAILSWIDRVHRAG